MLYLEGNLLYSVVNNQAGDRFVELARECGAGGGTVIPAKGTASNSILRMLGLGDKSREVVLIMLDENIAGKIIEKACNDEKIQGISALVGRPEDCMENSWKMITVIVNSGYADDIMETARKAGARGGTITNARGTAPENQEKFLGITIVPEKEMLTILVPSEKADAIIEAINAMPCLQQQGIGIICVQDVKKFVNLGTAK